MGTARSTSIEFGCPNYDGVRTSVPRPMCVLQLVLASKRHKIYSIHMIHQFKGPNDNKYNVKFVSMNWFYCRFSQDVYTIQELSDVFLPYQTGLVDKRS